MKQLCIRLDQKTFDKIKHRAEEKCLKLSEYIRQLIALGLRIEEMSEKKSTQDKDQALFTDLGSSKHLWEKELTWTLENRFLLRCLVNKLYSEDNKIESQLLHESKSRAKNFVLGLLNEEVSEDHIVSKTSE